MNSFRLSESNSEYGVDTVRDTRIRQDLKKHNWLLIKLVTRLRQDTEVKSPRSVNTKPSSQITKRSHKRKQTLPISIPIVFFLQYLEKKKSLVKNIEYKHTMVKSKMFCKDSKPSNSKVIKTSLDKDNIISQKIDCLSHNDNTNRNVGMSCVDDKTTKKELPKSRNAMEIKLCAVPITVRSSNSKACGTDEQITAMASKVEQSTQTLDVTILQEKDQELLATLNRYGYTQEDLNRFYQNSIRSNNNEYDLQSFNEIDVNEAETIYSDISDDTSIEEITDDVLNEEAPNLAKSNAQNADEIIEINEEDCNLNLQNTIKEKQVELEQSNVLSRATLNKLRACSDLNKLVLGSFYEGMHLVGYTCNKPSMHKEFSQLTHSLVDKIYGKFMDFIDYKAKPPDRVTEVIDLSDVDECEVLPGKRKAAHLSVPETKRLVKKNPIVSKQHVQHRQQEVQTNINTTPQIVPSPVPNQEPTQRSSTVLRHIQNEQECLPNSNHYYHLQQPISVPDTHPVRPAFGYNRDPRLAQYDNSNHQDRRHEQNIWYGNRNIPNVPQYPNTIQQLLQQQQLQQRQLQHQQRQQQQRQQQQLRQQQLQQQQQQQPHQRLPIPHNTYHMRSNRTFEQMLQQQNVQYTSSDAYPYNFAQRQ